MITISIIASLFGLVMFFYLKFGVERLKFIQRTFLSIFFAGVLAAICVPFLLYKNQQEFIHSFDDVSMRDTSVSRDNIPVLHAIIIEENHYYLWFQGKAAIRTNLEGAMAGIKDATRTSEVWIFPTSRASKSAVDRLMEKTANIRRVVWKL